MSLLYQNHLDVNMPLKSYLTDKWFRNIFVFDFCIINYCVISVRTDLYVTYFLITNRLMEAIRSISPFHLQRDEITNSDENFFVKVFNNSLSFTD